MPETAATASALDRAPAGRPDLDSSAGRFASAGPDAPVRVEVAMPRELFDRLTNHDEAPACRYETATRRAEFVAEPTFAHESRAAIAGELFTRVAVALEAAGAPIEMQVSRATRLLSDDGAFEPDEGLFIGSEKIAAAERARRLAGRPPRPSGAGSGGRDRPQHPFEPQARTLLPDGRAGSVDVEPP